MKNEAWKAAKAKYRASPHGKRHEYEYAKTRRLANPEKHRQHSRQWYRRKKLKAIELKGGVCIDCKQQVHPAAFDFHHVDPTTKESAANAQLMARGWDFIVAELEKCVLLCANCHRIRHFQWESDNDTTAIHIRSQSGDLPQ